MPHTKTRPKGFRSLATGPTLERLPIDDVIGPIHEHLQTGQRLVLEAPPGAGKTTRVPASLLAAGWLGQGKIIVSQPRRIAARLAARRVAQELGCEVGQQVGYRVRLEERVGSETRLIYETEGLLLRRLLSGDLAGAACLILDEVHERSVTLDSIIALLPERAASLRVVAMSATLDADELLALWPDAGRVQSRGRSFPVEIVHQANPDDRPLEIQLRAALAGLDRDDQGDILVFLPGAREIRRCQSSIARTEGVDVLPLYGDLPIGEQARVVSPASGAPRRVILATNIAETSLTLPRVTTVIDSGLGRIARHDPMSGVSRLETTWISRARAVQRAGRAGRVGPGRCVRLYTKGQFEARPSQDPPEIVRTDLSDLLLLLTAHDLAPADLRWLTPAPDRAWQTAAQLLERLGAHRNGRATSLGRTMARFPLPPRLARLLAAGIQSADVSLERICRVGALLAERDIRRRTSHPGSNHVALGDSDLDDRLERLEQAMGARFSRRKLTELDLDESAVRSVDAAARQLAQIARQCGASGARRADDADALVRCLLVAFPDRVAQRRGTSNQLLLCTGLTASLADDSCVQRSALALALSATTTHTGQTVVHMAVRVEPDWLLRHASTRVGATDEIVYNPHLDQLEQVSRLTYGKLVLDESKSLVTAGAEGAAILAAAALQKGAAVFDPAGRLRDLRVRLRILEETGTLPALDEVEQSRISGWHSNPNTLEAEALQLGCQNATSIKDLAMSDLTEALLLEFSPALGLALRDQTPQYVQLPSGRRLLIHYEQDRVPWVESRLQDFFSVVETPSIARGRLALQVHLLAPNKRAVQVTQDLAGFWSRHYPELRRQLMRRYPKHSWPEDGRHASPPAPGRLR